jgi:MSHA biogenesis protein MshN
MSLINKMLQDLDKRHAGDGGGKTLTQQLRPVKAASKGWRRIMFEVGAGLIVGAGWAGWVYYQIAPRSVVTELAYRSRPQRVQASAVSQITAAPQAPPPAVVAATGVPAQAGAPQLAPAMAPDAAAPAPPANEGTEAATVDMLKLATEIATPFTERPVAARPGAGSSRAAAAAPVPRTVKHGNSAPGTMAQGAAATAEPSPGSIDKHMHPSTSAARAENEFRKATELLNRGRVAEAIDGYKLALQQDTGHAAARQALVALLLENRRIEEAQQYLQEGLTLYPDRYAYAILLARIQVDRGDLQGAHDLLSKYAGSAANDAEYHAFDAALLQRLGRHKEAVADYQVALKLAPGAALWWMGLGISLQADNRDADALDAFRRAKSTGGLSPALVAFVDQRLKQLQ